MQAMKGLDYRAPFFFRDRRPCMASGRKGSRLGFAVPTKGAICIGWGKPSTAGCLFARASRVTASWR